MGCNVLKRPRAAWVGDAPGLAGMRMCVAYLSALHTSCLAAVAASGSLRSSHSSVPSRKVMGLMVLSGSYLMVPSGSYGAFWVCSASLVASCCVTWKGAVPQAHEVPEYASTGGNERLRTSHG